MTKYEVRYIDISSKPGAWPQCAIARGIENIANATPCQRPAELEMRAERNDYLPVCRTHIGLMITTNLQ